MSYRLPLAAAGVLMLALAYSNHGAHRLVVLLVLAPLLEETVFRAGVQEALSRHCHFRPCMVNALTAAAFGLAHVTVRADAAAFAVALPALVIGMVYQRSGRLRECIVLHAAMNAIWLGWSLTGPGLFGSR